MKTMARHTIFALLLLSLQSCSFLHYHPGEETSNICRGWTYDQCVDKYGKPDEEVSSPNGEILSGRGIFKRAMHKERHVFVLKDKRIIDEFYVVQVIEGNRWACGIRDELEIYKRDK